MNNFQLFAKMFAGKGFTPVLRNESKHKGTTNHGKGESKKRRKMAARSRKINRGRK